MTSIADFSARSIDGQDVALSRFEGEVVEAARMLLDVEPDPASPEPLARLLAQSVLHAPGFTIRGGTNEILRGVVAKGVGLR